LEKEPLLTQVWEICTTVASDESAQKIAQALLAARVAACIQISGPIRSFYRWKGAIQDDLEWKLTIKTSLAKLESCWNEIRRIHPYEIPELLARPATKASIEYARWIDEQTAVSPATTLDSNSSAPTWHLRIAGLPENAIPGPRATVLGKEVETLRLPTGPIPMQVTFEAVADVLSRYPNLHFEPDGAFTWGSIERRTKDLRMWQLDGMIYDRENRIEFVELKGNCDRATWQAFTQVLSGVEYGRLVVQWIDQGIWISETEFNICIE
jgi:periplasmic divalent cation tolerance protein